MMGKKSMLILCMAAMAGLAQAHETFRGRCPTFKPMPGFEWNRFKDKRWYAVEKFDTSQIKCLTYTFQEDDIGLREIVQRSEVKGLSRLGAKNKFTYRGKLAVPNSSNPADMMVRFELNILGSSSYVIMDTDYDNYAMLCTCQDKRILFDAFTFHRMSCTILQSVPQKNKAIVEKLHKMLNQQLPRGDGELADHDFSVVSHDGCNYEDDDKGLQLDVAKILGSSDATVDATVVEVRTLPPSTREEVTRDGVNQQIMEEPRI